MSKPKRIIGRVATPIVHQNGGVPILDRKIVDLRDHKPKDQLDELLQSGAQKAAVAEAQAAWAAEYERVAAIGAPQLLTFLLTGASYGPDNVEGFALSVLAAMTAAGYMVVRRSELRGMIEEAVTATREGNPTAFDPQPES